MPPENERSGVGDAGAATSIQDRDGDTASTSKDTQGEDRRPSPGTAERPAKKMKRGKYISRACISCQQRKVKGGNPCEQCIVRSQRCVGGPRGEQCKYDANGRTQDSGQLSRVFNSGESIAGSELLARLAEVENRLSEMQELAMTSIMRESTHANSPPVVQGPTSGEDHGSPNTIELQEVLETDGQSFAGELSMISASDDKRDRSTAYDKGCGSASSRLDTDGTLTLLQPNMSTVTGEKPGGKVRAWLETHLARHGLVADRAEWGRYLQVFLDEVHILYPFLHPPSLWGTFNEVWEYSALWFMTKAEERENKRMSVALLCFCLALGRCSISTRMSDADGVHSSGWSLYCAGITLVPDILKMSNKCAKSLLTLQILTLRVLYLFRLDATQRASRVLAVAVSNAYMAGLHRQSTLNNMPVTQSQLCCRTWWCIYILDRRLAIESGRPCVIQDSNLDTALPLDLDDDWLTRFVKSTDPATSLQQEIVAATSAGSVTSVPYLTAMVRFSRVVGKAWDLLYGIKASTVSSSAMVGYVDMTLCDVLESLPISLTYNPKLAYQNQFSTRQRFQVKQSLLLFMCTTFIRLLIRRPFKQEGQAIANTVEDNELESLTVCVSLAASIVDAHQAVRDDTLKHCFPLCHYITSATMVMTSLVVREPGLRRRYRDQMLAAARSLNTYCHTIWVSGKMMRWASKLSLMVQGIHANGAPAANGDSRKQRPRSGAYNLNDNYPADGMIQLTPESDVLCPPQLDATEQRTSRTLSSANNGTDATRGWASDEQDGTQQRVAHNAEHDNPADSVEASGRTELAFPNQWPMRGNGTNFQQLEDLPGWAMMDFNFEDIDKGDDLGFGALGGGLLAVQDTGNMGVRDTGSMPGNQDNAAGWFPSLEIGADQAMPDLFGTASGGV